MKVVSQGHKKLTNGQAFKTVGKKSSVFAMSRVLYAGNTLAIGWALGHLKKDDVAASAFIVSLQYVFVGISSGVVLSKGIFTGEKNDAKQYVEVGRISRASWRLAVLMSVFSLTGLMISPTIMKAAKIATESAAAATQDDMNYFSIAVPGILLAASDQQLAVAAKDAKVTVMFNLIYSGVASGLGIPMALGYMGGSLDGAKTLGISTAISSWLGLAAMRAYYHFNSHYTKYELCKKDVSAPRKYFKKLFSLGWKIGAQSGAEFLNFMAISFLLSAYGRSHNRPAVEMVTPLLQIGSALGLIAIGFGQAQAALIANERGAMREALENNDSESADNSKSNIVKIAKMGSFMAVTFSAVVAALCYAKSDFFVEFFMGSNFSDEQNQLAQKILKVGLLSLIFDTMRNNYAGNLSGFKDVNYVTKTNFALMTVAFVAIGSAMLYGDDMLLGSMWLRNSVILLSALVNIKRWTQFAGMSTDEMNVIGRNKVTDSAEKQLVSSVESENYGAVDRMENGR